MGTFNRDGACKATGKDWHPADIIAALHKIGISLRQLARANGYADDTLGAALTRSYPKAEALIANALNLPVSTIWPERERLRAERRARLLPNQSHSSPEAAS
jgi:Ner family transcriptional regulator